MREAPRDAAAESDRAARALKKLERERKLDALRKKKKRRELRAAAGEKPSAADTEVRPPAEASGGNESPLSDLTEPAAAEPSADEIKATAAAIAKQIDSPDKLAALLASFQLAAQERCGEKRPRIAKVIGALDLAKPNGEPTQWGKTAAGFTWPWVESEGLALLAALGPRPLALIGLGMILLPAAFVAFDQYAEHQLEREVRKEKLLRDARNPPPAEPAPGLKLAKEGA